MDSEDSGWIMFVRHVGGVCKYCGRSELRKWEKGYTFYRHVLSYLPWEGCNKVSETSDQTYPCYTCNKPYNLPFEQGPSRKPENLCFKSL